MPWNVLFQIFKYAVSATWWFLRRCLVAPFTAWPVALWTRLWPLLRRQTWAAVFLVPGLWLSTMLLAGVLLGLLPLSMLRDWAAPLAGFFRGELQGFLTGVLLPDWLVFWPNGLVRLLLLWAWLPLICSLFASPLYLGAVLARTVALSPDELLGWGKKAVSEAFGSAAFATETQGKGWRKKVRPAALVMGRSGRNEGRFYTIEGHVLTCAPTGAGKGIGCVLPNLWTYPGTVFCLDVKGENYLRAAARRRELGHDVWLVDPFKVTGAASVALDWLAPLRAGDEESVSLAAALAEAMVVRTPGAETYWDDAAVHLLQGLLLEAATLDGGHVVMVRDWLTAAPDVFQARLEKMAQDTHGAWGMLARAANSFLAKADKERSGVLSTAQRHTAFLDDPRLLEVLRPGEKAGFKTLQSFVQRPTTLFFVLPPDKLTTYSRFVRVTLALLVQALIKRGLVAKEDTLILLDEFAQLGYFPVVEEGLALLRGYGASIWCLVQDLSQLKAVYPKWRTFVANGHLQVFGVQDVETARYVSELLGQKTVRVENSGETRAWAHDQKGSSSANESSAEVARALYTPDEVRRLSDDQVLLFERGQAPRQLTRLNTTQKRELVRLAAFAPKPRPTFRWLWNKEQKHAAADSQGAAGQQSPA